MQNTFNYRFNYGLAVLGMKPFARDDGDFLEFFLGGDLQESFGEGDDLFFGQESGFVKIQLELGLSQVCVFVAVFESFFSHGALL